MNAHAPVLKWLVSMRAPAREADWDALYRQELPRIYNFFRYRIGDDALAEDLTSTTFEKAWRARHQHRRDLAAFSTWLFAIARNVAIDHFRRRRVEVPIDELNEAPAPGDLEAETLRRLQFGRMSQLLAELPDRDEPALRVTCITCHRGVTRPEPIEAIMRTTFDESAHSDDILAPQLPGKRMRFRVGLRVEHDLRLPVAVAEIVLLLRQIE